MRDPKLAEVPVVIVSAAGFSHETIGTQFRPAGYVQKPIARDQLLGVIRDLVRSGPPGQLDPADRTAETKRNRA
jgi:hypothetical protein